MTSKLENLVNSIYYKLKKYEVKKISLDKDNLKKFIYSLLKEYSQEKICTWKSVAATKDCNLEKDKGCKLTKPDKIGEEKIYLLERQL